MTTSPRRTRPTNYSSSPGPLSTALRHGTHRARVVVSPVHRQRAVYHLSISLLRHRLLPAASCPLLLSCISPQPTLPSSLAVLRQLALRCHARLLSLMLLRPPLASLLPLARRSHALRYRYVLPQTPPASSPTRSFTFAPTFARLLSPARSLTRSPSLACLLAAYQSRPRH